MKIVLPAALFLLLASSSLSAQFVYVNPLPDSKDHRPEITIALNPGSEVLKTSLYRQGLFRLTGTISGDHAFKTILSTDGHTIVLKPAVPFSHGEEVTVQVADGIKTTGEKEVSGTTFSFSIIRAEQLLKPGQKFPEEEEEADLQRAGASTEKLTTFPSYNILVNNNPAPGSYFFCNKNDIVMGPSYLAIMENDESFYYSEEKFNKPNDWKLNGNCTFTYFDQDKFTWMMLDTSFNLIDSFQCGNGLEGFTDAHEFRIYPDGHSYIEANDAKTIDMSQYVPGGDTAAFVRGFTVQRLDADHNVVFEWRSWDHFEITDAVSQIVLTLSIIDLVHGNSVEEDMDGNLILSERHMSEITKINSVTGDIIWRMGGENNMFTFVNDITDPPFYYQHYVRRLPNGHLILYNNNNYQVPQESAAKEYALDETNHVATLVWSYKHPLTNNNPVFGRAGGNAQRLSNGNTVINWGVKLPTSGNPGFTEIDSLGTILFEFEFDDPDEYIYRVTKSIWQTCDAVPTGNAELPGDAIMNIFPNPSSGSFSLSLNGFGNETISLLLENMLGEIIYTEQLQVPEGIAKIPLTMPALPAGIYVLNVSGANQKLTGKLLVQ